MMSPRERSLAEEGPVGGAIPLGEIILEPDWRIFGPEGGPAVRGEVGLGAEELMFEV